MATVETRAIALVLALKEELPVLQSALAAKLQTVAGAKNPIATGIRTRPITADSSFDTKASIQALLQTKRLDTMLALVKPIDTTKNLDNPTKQKVYEANTIAEIYKNYITSLQQIINGKLISYYYLIKTIKAVNDIVTPPDPNIPAINTAEFLAFKRTIQLKAYVDILAADLQKMKAILEERKAREPKTTGIFIKSFKPSSITRITEAATLLDATGEQSIQGMIQIAGKLQRMADPTLDLITGLAHYMKNFITATPVLVSIFKDFQPNNKINTPLFILQLPIIGYQPTGADLDGTAPGLLANGIQGIVPASDGVMQHRMESDDGLDPNVPVTPGTPGTPGSSTLSAANEQELALAKLPQGRTIRIYGLDDIPVPPIGTPIPDDWKNIDPYRIIADQLNLVNASQASDKGDGWAKKILEEVMNNECFNDRNIMYSTTCPTLRNYLYEMSMASLTGDFTMQPPDVATNEKYGIVTILLLITLDTLASALDNNPALKGLTGFSRDLARELLSIEDAINAILNPKPLLLGSTGSTIDVSIINTEINNIAAMIDAII